MMGWTAMKDDIGHAMGVLRRGFRRAAVISTQEADRLKSRYRLRALEEQLAVAYRALGKYGLRRIQTAPFEWARDREWAFLVREVEARRTDREKLKLELESFDRENIDAEMDGGGDRYRN